MEPECTDSQGESPVASLAPVPAERVPDTNAAYAAAMIVALFLQSPFVVHAVRSGFLMYTKGFYRRAAIATVLFMLLDLIAIIYLGITRRSKRIPALAFALILIGITILTPLLIEPMLYGTVDAMFGLD